MNVNLRSHEKEKLLVKAAAKFQRTKLDTFNTRMVTWNSFNLNFDLVKRYKL